MWAPVGFPRNLSVLLQRDSRKLVDWAMSSPVHHPCPSCRLVHRSRTNLAVSVTAAPNVAVLHLRAVACAASSCSCYNPCLSRDDGLHLVLDSVVVHEIVFVVGVDCSLPVQP